MNVFTVPDDKIYRVLSLYQKGCLEQRLKKVIFSDQMQRGTFLVSSVYKMQKVRGSSYTYPFGGVIVKNFSLNMHLDPH